MNKLVKNKKIRAFLNIIKNTREMALLMGLACFVLLFSIVLNQFLPFYLNNLKTDVNVSNFAVFLAFTLNEVLLAYSSEILSHFFSFFFETKISFYLFKQVCQKKFTEIEKTSANEKYSQFLIKKNAFIKMICIGIFSFPINSICIILHFYHLSNNKSFKSSKTLNCAVILLVTLIYVFFTLKGIQIREKLKKRSNFSKIKKNEFCFQSLENFEFCKANDKQSSYNDEFNHLSRSSAISELKYYLISENIRLLTRIFLSFAKIFFIFLHLNNPLFNLSLPFVRFADLNFKFLSLRNDLYFFLEYWNEFDVDTNESNVPASQLDYKLSDKLEATCKNWHFKYLISDSDKSEIKSRFNSNKIVISSKSKTHISGPQGCGKTTFLMESIGYGQDIFNISIDEIDCSQYKNSCVLPNVSFCSQKQLFFEKSIFFNLNYGNDLKKEDLIKKMNKFDKLPDFLIKLLEGSNQFGNICEDLPYELSGGQKQVICIIRCLLKDADVYIFDEPALFLDFENKKFVYNAIINMKNKTVIVSSRSNEFSDQFDVKIEFEKLN
jgi:ABC-type bacteriocin/lantibiotic exporter with double-glycine peptidase domain